ncbi:MAG: hypothetical protein QOH96_1802 [Blastocatellia bacterium]|jgi:hypothetical protein|nr:hypothetical protein [Blastocatellia bacterium]
MRVLVFFGGVLVAALGGVILYRTLFVEPPAGYVITETHVRELPDTAKLVAGSLLLLAGALVAFFSLKRMK